MKDQIVSVGLGHFVNTIHFDGLKRITKKTILRHNKKCRRFLPEILKDGYDCLEELRGNQIVNNP